MLYRTNTDDTFESTKRCDKIPALNMIFRD